MSDGAKTMEQIYQAYARQIFRYLYSLSHDADLAEELTQETFYRAVYSIKRYDGTCKMFVWLCQIAKHVWYQHLDKRKRTEAQPLPEDTPAREPSPEAALLSGDNRVAIYKAIHALNEPMREVVHMRLSGEFTFAEIGAVLGKSENWARVTFHRAKQILSEVLP